jgi:hypothetical protein
MARISIGEREFKSKDAAAQEIRRILHSSPVDEPLTGGELALISALFARHPRKEETPVGFCVGTNSFNGARTIGFHGIREDGSRIVWSYKPCLSPQSDNPHLFRTMRAAIMLSQREALHAAYQRRAIIPCHHCQAGVTREVAEVHHLPPKFRDIADAFVALIGVPEIVNADIGDDFRDPGTKRRWIMFHDAVAQRVVLCRACNEADEKSQA